MLSRSNPLFIQCFLFSFIKLLNIRLKDFRMSLCFFSYLLSNNIVLKLGQCPCVLLVAKTFLSILINLSTPKFVGMKCTFFTTLCYCRGRLQSVESIFSTSRCLIWVQYQIEHIRCTTVPSPSMMVTLPKWIWITLFYLELLRYLYSNAWMNTGQFVIFRHGLFFSPLQMRLRLFLHPAGGTLIFRPKVLSTQELTQASFTHAPLPRTKVV